MDLSNSISIENIQKYKYIHRKQFSASPKRNRKQPPCRSSTTPTVLFSVLWRATAVSLWRPKHWVVVALLPLPQHAPSTPTQSKFDACTVRVLDIWLAVVDAVRAIERRHEALDIAAALGRESQRRLAVNLHHQLFSVDVGDERRDCLKLTPLTVNLENVIESQSLGWLDPPPSQTDVLIFTPPPGALCSFVRPPHPSLPLPSSRCQRLRGTVESLRNGECSHSRAALRLTRPRP